MAKETNIHIGDIVEVQMRGKYSRQNQGHTHQTYRGIYQGTIIDAKDKHWYVVLTNVFQNNRKSEREKSDCSKHSIRRASIFMMSKVDKLWSITHR